MKSRPPSDDLLLKMNIKKHLPFSQFFSSIGIENLNPTILSPDPTEEEVNKFHEFSLHYLILEYISHTYRENVNQLPSPIMELNFSRQCFNQCTGDFEFHQYWSINYIKSLNLLIVQDKDTPEHYYPLLKFKENNLFSSLYSYSLPLLHKAIIKIADHLFTYRTLSDDRTKMYVQFLIDLFAEKQSQLFGLLPTLINLIDMLLINKEYGYFITLFNGLKENNEFSIIQFKLFEHLYKNSLHISDISINLATEEILPEEITFDSLLEDIQKYYLVDKSINYSTDTIAELLDYIKNKIELSSQQQTNPDLETIASFFSYLEKASLFNNNINPLYDTTLSWLKYLYNADEKSKEYPIFTEWLESSLIGSEPILFPPIFQYCQLPSSTTIDDKSFSLHDSIPFTFKIFLTPHSLNLYQVFLDKFEKLNQSNDERYKIDYASFIFKNQIKLINLYEIMGDNLFPFLNGLMGTSLLNMDRFFNTFKIIRGDLYNLFNELFFSQHKIKHNNLKSILLFPAIFYEIADSNSKEMMPHQIKPIPEIRETKSLDDIPIIIEKYLIELYCEKLNIQCTENMDLFKIRERLPSQALHQLLIGRKSMQDNTYKAVFDELVKIDLSSHLSFNDFTMNMQQTSTTGKALALHNNAIVEKLKSCGINIEKSFNYTRTKTFIFSDTIPSYISSIWEEITLLEKITKQLPETHKITALKKMVDKFISQLINRKKPTDISKVPAQNLSKIKNPSNLRFLEKIIKICSLINNENIQPAEFYSCIANLNTNFLQLTQSLAANKDTVKKIKYFRVQQWDKEQITTFFLGNYLSCCLATNRAEFSALIQRRMDKAMFMHVVIDEQSKEPICGNWLFFAENRDYPSKDIFVVANYFEIRNNYTRINSLADLLVTELIKFTGEFTQEIGARDFLMRPLTYGLIPDFNYYHYNLTKVNIRKVGGYLKLNNNDSTPQNEYYLRAVYLDSFYSYTNSTYLPCPQNAEEQLRILQRMPKDHRWEAIKANQHILHNSADLFHLSSFVTQKHLLEFSKMFIHLIPNIDEATFILVGLAKKDQMPFLINNQHLIHDGYELANAIKYFPRHESVIHFVKTQRNKIKDGYQLAQVLAPLQCSDDPLQFAKEERHKIKDTKQLLSVSRQLPEKYRPQFEKEQKLLWSTYSFSFFPSHSPKTKQKLTLAATNSLLKSVPNVGIK